ncbi:Serine/threonine protein kinase, partial [Globisporangium splendens]
MSAGDNNVVLSATCTRPELNTLTSVCYDVCAASVVVGQVDAPPLCVNYAAEPKNDASRVGDGNYYYQGCAFAGMSTCKANVSTSNCEIQCLQTNNVDQETWVLDVAQPQKDKAETSLFQYVESLALPSTLKNLSIVGTTELTRKVPVTFATGAFESGTSLERIIIQRTNMQQFDPRGSQPFSALQVLDLSENGLTEIPLIVYEMRNLTELYLQGNAIQDVHITTGQLEFLKSLSIFEGTMKLSSACQDGYQSYSWSSKTVCYGDDVVSDYLGSGSSEQSTTSTAGSKSNTGTLLVVLAAAGLVVVAVIAGVFLLKRAKRKATDNPVANGATDQKGKSAAARKLAKKKFSPTMRMSSDLTESLQSSHQGSFRKNTFKDIPSEHLQMLSVVTTNGVVSVKKAKYNKKLVYVTQLKLKEDAAENCEMVLDVVPVVSQLRHPQLLSVVGLTCEDFHPVSVVCEAMDYGTLEDYLIQSGRDLTWRNFKLRAAMDIAGGLMYLHSKHKLSYDGLNGRSVFVDSEKGCKLNTLLASVAEDIVPSRRYGESSRGYFAPEILAGEPSRSSSDMFAFGVLLAQLDTCQTADEMIRNSWRMRSMIEPNPMSTTILLGMEGSHRSTNSTVDESNSTSLMSMFPFTDECPPMVKELASVCLQYDPSLRPTKRENPQTVLSSTIHRQPQSIMAPLPVEKTTCAVCLDDLQKNLAALPCGHVFHHSCASRALTRVAKCPICRKKTLERQAVWLFYAAEASATSKSDAATNISTTITSFENVQTTVESTSSSTEPSSSISLSDRFTAIRRNMHRLAVNQRMISNHSIRLQSENFRLRQENARLEEQTTATRRVTDALELELNAWKRISTSSYAHFNTLAHEKAEKEQTVAAALEGLTSQFQELSVCESCDSSMKTMNAKVKALRQSIVDSKKAAKATKLACCSVVNGSKAVKAFCGRHSNAQTRRAAPSRSVASPGAQED